MVIYTGIWLDSLINQDRAWQPGTAVTTPGIIYINLIILCDKNLVCFTLRYAYLQMNTSQYRHVSAGGDPPPFGCANVRTCCTS